VKITLSFGDDEEEVGRLSATALDLWSDMSLFDDYIRGVWKHGNGFDSADEAVEKMREQWLSLWERWADAVR